MKAPPLTRILLVEDEMDIGSIARLALEAVGGFTVEVCLSGKEALQKAPIFLPDLILLDVMMPGMDGPTTMGELRKDPVLKSIPVVFLTAKVLAHEIAHYKEIGGLEVIKKPFDPMLLPAKIKAIWENCHH